VSGEVSRESFTSNRKDLYTTITVYMMAVDQRELEKVAEQYRRMQEWRKKYYSDKSTILVSKEVKRELDRRKVHPEESYDSVLRRVLGLRR
jgi:uncharacterized protein YydD (DUF2326 family)